MWTYWKDVLTTGSENSNEVDRHPQEFSSEGEAGQTRQEEEGCSLWGAVQGLPMCVHWKDGKNLGEKQLSEHKTAVTKHKTKNGIAVHSWTNKHQVNWATVKQEERGYWKRRVLEALHIHQQPRTSNLDCGLTINPSWLPLLEKPPTPWVTPLTTSPTYNPNSTSHHSLHPHLTLILFLTSSPVYY